MSNANKRSKNAQKAESSFGLINHGRSTTLLQQKHPNFITVCDWKVNKHLTHSLHRFMPGFELFSENSLFNPIHAHKTLLWLIQIEN